MKRTTLAILAALSLTGVATQASTLYSNNFETNTNGFSGAGATVSSEGLSAYGFGTTYLRNDAGGNPAPASRLTLNTAAAAGATLNFDLAVLDSWDGPAGYNCCGPDVFNVQVDGTTVFSYAFNIFNGSAATDPALTTLYYGPSIAYNPGWGDQGYSVSLSLGNLAAGTHFIDFFASGSGWQAGADESWGIDNVTVSGQLASTGNVPEPGSLALVALAVAGLAATRRRR